MIPVEVRVLHSPQRTVTRAIPGVPASLAWDGYVSLTWRVALFQVWL